jgi:hypothetical protein
VTSSGALYDGNNDFVEQAVRPSLFDLNQRRMDPPFEFFPPEREKLPRIIPFRDDW